MLLKYQPEDFIVKEKTCIGLKETGPYSYWVLQKKKITTFSAIHALARWLNISEKNIGFAGAKDKIGVTEQFISIKNCQKENLVAFAHSSINLLFTGYGDKPLMLGDLYGNSFVIIARDVDEAELSALDAKIRDKTSFSFINYFGEQRFSRRNAVVGKLLLLKKYNEAVLELIAAEGEYEYRVKKHIQQHPKDYVGALKGIPKMILLFFIHAYQSALWNEYVCRIDKDEVPVIGFGTELDEEENKIIMPIMQREGITFRDFVNPPFPELTVEGCTRQKWCIATELDYRVENDDIFVEKKKVVLSFFLPKGCYATICCKALFA